MPELSHFFMTVVSARSKGEGEESMRKAWNLQALDGAGRNWHSE
jgi:hypothetical protein